MPWNIDFFPRGKKYSKAQLINVFNMQAAVEIPETVLRTIRLSVTCQRDLEAEQRFKVGVSKISKCSRTTIERYIFSCG